MSVGPFDYVYKGLTVGAPIIGALCCCISRYMTILSHFALDYTSYGVLLSYRLYLGYHTVAQVAVGVGAGCVAGAVWFLVVHLALSPHFPHIYTWCVC